MTPPSAAAPEPPRPAAVVLRPATARDRAAIEQLVAAIAAEVYGHLFPGAPPPPEGKWDLAVVAEAGGALVGVIVADDDWVEDLWVARDWRGWGIGGRLLAAGEARIRAAGYRLANLRVIAENLAARRFYARHGWTEYTTYPHEKWGFEMIDLLKRLPPGPKDNAG